MTAGRYDERGVSLPELMVAGTLLLVVLTTLLGQYALARRAQTIGQGLVEMQQSTRVAWDRIASDLRLAGLAFEPDGQPGRPDEAFEVARSTTVVVRADFDGIVGYALAKPDGSSAGELTFEADVLGVPRDGITETVTLSGIALSPGDPPYTLYRFRIRPDSTTAVRTPVVDQIRSLRFRYYDSAGEEIEAAGSDDDAESRRRRAAIRRARVELVGMNRSAADSAFRLVGEVACVNAGSVSSLAASAE